MAEINEEYQHLLEEGVTVDHETFLKLLGEEPLFNYTIWERIQRWFRFNIGKRWRNLKHWVITSYQRARYGYAQEDTWDIGWWLSKRMPEMVRDLRERGTGYPGGITFEEWQDKLRTIEEGFEAARRHIEHDFNNEQERRHLHYMFLRGMHEMEEWYFHLWD